jgi:ATP/ADP translocase
MSIFQSSKYLTFNILIVFVLIIYTNIIDILWKKDLDSKYLKIKQFEDSYTRSFLDIFFFESDFRNENI